MRSKTLIVLGVLVPALLAASGQAFAGNGGLAPVPPESSNAQGISTTWWVITAFVAAIFVLVEVLLVLFIVRYRRRGRARDADGAQVHGSTKLETMWTLGPVLILFVIAALVLVKLPDIQDAPAAAAGTTELEIAVQGRQFYWEFTYPNGVVAVNRMRVPVDTVVQLDVSSPHWDVIHSWWIPALGGKIDAIPGTVNHTWFEAEREGVFDGQCAELCGLQHAVMTAEVEVMSRAAFDDWLSGREQAGDAAEPLGEETFNGACATCHGLSGQGDVAANAPALDGNPIVLDRSAVEEVVTNGRNAMPPVGRDWPEEQMTALENYLEEQFG